MNRQRPRRIASLLLALLMLPAPAAAVDLIGNDFGAFTPTARLTMPVWPGRDRLHFTISHGGFDGGFSKGIANGESLNYGGQVLTAGAAGTVRADVTVTRTAITFFSPDDPGATWKQGPWTVSSLFGFSWVDMQSTAVVSTATPPNTTTKDLAQAGLHLGVGWSWLPENRPWGVRGRFLVHANPVSVVDAFSRDPNLDEEYFLGELEVLGVMHVRWGELFAGLAAWRYVWMDTLNSGVAKLDMRQYGPLAGIALHF